jgi:hypothetical protein
MLYGPNRPTLECGAAQSLAALISRARCSTRKAGWKNEQISNLLSAMVDAPDRDAMLAILHENFCEIK